MFEAGTQVGRYEIQRRLGRGGMGTVYAAHDPILGRLVAIKVFAGDLDIPDARDRFEREARSAAGLAHPHIVAVYDFGEHESQPYIVMEYVQGETLAEVIRRKAPVLVRRQAALDGGTGRGRRLRAQDVGDSPRHQAGEPDHRPVRAAEDPGFRNRADARHRVPHQGHDRDAGLHGARTDPRQARSTAAPTCSRSAWSSTSCCRTPRPFRATRCRRSRIASSPQTRFRCRAWFPISIPTCCRSSSGS